MAEKFNQTGFSKWLNSGAGRIFRIAAGVLFLTYGLIDFRQPLGLASLIWSFFPLTAGGFDVCYISAALGGPFRGEKLRATQVVTKL